MKRPRMHTMTSKHSIARLQLKLSSLLAHTVDGSSQACKGLFILDLQNVPLRFEVGGNSVSDWRICERLLVLPDQRMMETDLHSSCP
jgi:hypothetical protein